MLVQDDQLGEITESVQAYNQSVIDYVHSNPALLTMSPQQRREKESKGEAPFSPVQRLASAKDSVIPGLDGNELGLRVIAGDSIEGVYLHMHGGGWCVGAADYQDAYLYELAKQTNLAIVSVNYRLAPEFPFPCGPNDCLAAALWLIEHAKSEFNTETLLMGGESSGAHLAALTMLSLAEKNLQLKYKSICLLYGVYDLSMTPSLQNWGEDRPLRLTTNYMKRYIDYFMTGSTVDRRDATISPLYANLDNMPPAFLLVGSLDPLLDDSLFLYQRWMIAGNKAKLLVFPGGIHGLNQLGNEMADLANQQIYGYVDEILKC